MAGAGRSLDIPVPKAFDPGSFAGQGKVMASFVQIAGESRFYQQTIVNDTISSVSWAISGAGAVLTGTQSASTSTSVLVETPVIGDYVLSCTIQTAGGQTLIGEARIQVVESIV